MLPVSSHDMSAAQKTLRLHDEIYQANIALDDLQEASPEARIIYISGNHEHRLNRYIGKHAPALDGMVNLQELLSLADRNIKWVAYGDYARHNHVLITHDLGKAGENAHRMARKKAGTNIVIGHTHRLGIEYEGSLKGAHFGAHFGWLGSAKASEGYKDKIGHQVDSVLGFGWAFEDGNCLHTQAIPILNYTCVVGGELYK